MTEAGSAMFDFFLAILEEIPTFLMAEPICYIFGCIIGLFAVALFSKLLRIN